MVLNNSDVFKWCHIQRVLLFITKRIKHLEADQVLPDAKVGGREGGREGRREGRREEREIEIALLLSLPLLLQRLHPDSHSPCLTYNYTSYNEAVPTFWCSLQLLWLK